jgi:aryl sulfotransferase
MLCVLVPDTALLGGLALGTPQRTRTYQNHHLDSTRWDGIVPRADDIVVTTSYKSGTTWMQHILLHMLYDDVDPLPNHRMISPWPDARFMGISKQDLDAQCEGVERRRFFKSHLPLDGLIYWPEAKYVIVGRDPRDVFMSFFNHYWNYTELSMSMMNSEGRVGDPLPKCPDDPRVLWADWISRGWFEWESEGYPFWSNMHHTQSYWDYRHLPNFYFVHYNDMLDDLDREVGRLAEFLDISLGAEHRARIVAGTTFENAKQRAAAEAEASGEGNTIWKGGSDSFFFKGSNGRWRDLLTEEDLALYEQSKERVLSSDCARWLEAGGSVSV